MRERGKRERTLREKGREREKTREREKIPFDRESQNPDQKGFSVAIQNNPHSPRSNLLD